MRNSPGYALPWVRERLLPRFLPPHARSRPKGDSKGFSSMLALFKEGYHRLTRPGPFALCILKAQEVTTKGVYRLLHALYYCR